MDVKCKFCREPWDIDTFHDAADEQGVTFDDIRVRFQKIGCKAIGWGDCNPDTKTEKPDMALAMLNELLGDDIDGIAAMTEDFRL